MLFKFGTFNDCTPLRRLRVGYVSPHFFAHAVNSFVEPILASHDRTACEVFCYSDVVVSDETTARLATHLKPPPPPRPPKR
jgi:predicted O-linked N-acetylglucosamine transferase (SPINDLY family)